MCVSPVINDFYRETKLEAQCVKLFDRDLTLVDVACLVTSNLCYSDTSLCWTVGWSLLPGEMSRDCKVVS